MGVKTYKDVRSMFKECECSGLMNPDTNIGADVGDVCRPGNIRLTGGVLLLESIGHCLC